jgi:integrase
VNAVFLVQTAVIEKRASARLFGVAADEWFAAKSLTLAGSSLRIEKDNLKHIKPVFERLLVTDITASDIGGYQKFRSAEDASAKTINLEVGTIRSILRRNRVWAEIQPDVKMLPTRDDIGKALSGDEEEALLRCCSESRSRSLYPAVVLALNTGMRYSEIRLLQWKQIDLRSRTLLVGKSKTESGTGRTIPLNRRILAVLEMWASHFPNRKSEHYVFPSEKYGAGTDGFKPCVYGTDVTKPINDWKEAWEGAKRRAGVVLTNQSGDAAATKMEKPENPPLQCRFHDLRHTACTRLLEGGVPYPVVATIMGWSASTAIRMAKRYGHIGQRAMCEAMKILEIPETISGSPKNPPKSPSNENERPN